MAKKTLKCSKCGRTFAMAAHLARHMAATHGAKKAKPAKTGLRRGKPGRRPGRPAASGSASRALQELATLCRALTAQREVLDEQIAAVEQAMKAIGGVR